MLSLQSAGPLPQGLPPLFNATGEVMVAREQSLDVYSRVIDALASVHTSFQSSLQQMDTPFKEKVAKIFTDERQQISSKIEALSTAIFSNGSPSTDKSPADDVTIEKFVTLLYRQQCEAWTTMLQDFYSLHDLLQNSCFFEKRLENILSMVKPPNPMAFFGTKFLQNTPSLANIQTLWILALWKERCCTTPRNRDNSPVFSTSLAPTPSDHSYKVDVDPPTNGLQPIVKHVNDPFCPAPRILIPANTPTQLSLFWRFISQNGCDIIDLSNQEELFNQKINQLVLFPDTLVTCKQRIDLDNNGGSIFSYAITNAILRTTRTIRRITLPLSSTPLSIKELDSLIGHLENSFVNNTVILCNNEVEKAGAIMAAYFLKKQILVKQTRAENLEQEVINLLLTLRYELGTACIQIPKHLDILFKFGLQLFNDILQPSHTTPSSKDTLPAKAFRLPLGLMATQKEKDVLALWQKLNAATDTLRTRQDLLPIYDISSSISPSQRLSPHAIAEAKFQVHCPLPTAVRVSGNQYLHANFINLSPEKQRFIAGFYPYDTTLFWKFIAQSGTDIVDLSGEECTYAPLKPKQSMQFDNITVTATNIMELLDGRTLHTYAVTDTLSKTTRNVMRLIEKKWDAHVGICVTHLSILVRHLEYFFTKETFIHCRLGCGRTGTLLGAYFLKKQILRGQIQRDNLGHELIAILTDLRKQRNHDFCENRHQFALLYAFGESLLDDISSTEQPSLLPISQTVTPSSFQKEPFQTLISLQTTFRKEGFLTLREKLLAELPGTKISYDDQNLTLTFGYEPSVLNALAVKTSLKDLRGDGIFSNTLGIHSEFCSTIWPTPYQTILDDMAQKAIHYFQPFQAPKKPTLAIPDQCSEQELLALCLKDYPGICLSALTKRSCPATDFLCSHFQFLVRHGVTTVFIGYLLTGSLQDEVNQFMQTGLMTSKALSIVLSVEQRLDLHKILVSARTAGIQRIIGIATGNEFIETLENNPSAQNYIVTQYSTLQAVNTYKDLGKYVIYQSLKKILPQPNSPGLSSLVGCPHIHVLESEKKGLTPSSTTNSTPFNTSLINSTHFCDALIVRDAVYQ